MSTAPFVAALRLAETSIASPAEWEAWRRIASLAEGAVRVSAAAPWRHTLQGAERMPKRAARSAIVQEIIDARGRWPWGAWLCWGWRGLLGWQASRPLTFGGRSAARIGEAPKPACARWEWAAAEAAREYRYGILSLAGRAVARGDGYSAEVEAALTAAGVAPWLARVAAAMPELRVQPRSKADVAFEGWFGQCLAEGWRPDGARIELHTGPMGGGKTSALMQVAHGADLVVQSAVNSRDGGALRTHDGAEVPAVATGCLWREIYRALYGEVHRGYVAPKVLTIVVDEGQWFSADDWARTMAACVGHKVRFVVAALDWSAQRTRLGSIEWILGAAVRVEWHRGQCVDCGAPSTITRWDGEGPPGVGSIGEGAYRPVCDAHWRAPAVDGGGQ